MSNRVCFLVYKDWEAVLQEFDDATFRELITAIFKYGFDREERELSPMARIAMKLIKPVMERDWQKYIDRANINKQNGAKGGRPQKNNGLLENPKNPMGNSETQNNPKKQNTINKSKLISKDINLRQEVSSAGLPCGQPAPKPEFCEVLEFYKNQSGQDDAYFCDEFMLKMESYKCDWENWQDKLIAYAVKAGRLNE